jgi:hypothetical protein
MSPRRLVAATLVALCLLVPASSVGAQEPGATTTLPSGAEPPSIIPRPNSGAEPTEAGDRGGALQLGLLAVLVVVIGGAAVVVVRQSRRARAGDHR